MNSLWQTAASNLNRIGRASGLVWLLGNVRHVTCAHDTNGLRFQLEDFWIWLGALPDAASVDFSQSGPISLVR